MPNAKFLCRIWKVTRRSQSAILNQTSGDAAFIPQFPPSPPTGSFYLFGTAPSEVQGGSQFYNNQACGSTIYWRSQLPVNSQSIQLSTVNGAVSTNTVFYYYLGGDRIRLIAIPQADYNARITTALDNTELQLRKRHSVACTTSSFYSEPNHVLTGTPIVADVRYVNPADTAIASSLNNAYAQTNVTYFEKGQGTGINYGIRVKWVQSVGNATYTANQTYQSDRVGTIPGSITAIRVYIVNSRYALSVSYGTNSVLEPLYLTVGGNPLYANNYPAGNVAIAQFGIKNVVCERIDGQADTFGNAPNVTASSGLSDTIVPLGFTDHDKPITYQGVTYVPYYGGSASDYSYGSSGEAASNEIEFAIAVSGIREIDLISGLYQGAEVITYYYDWGNQAVVFEDPPGYFGKVTLNDSRHGAYKFKIELKSALALMDQKESVIIGSFCTKEFGSSDCGVNLLSRGLVDTTTITAITDNKKIVINSTRGDNYYGQVEFMKSGIVYSVGVASYKSSTKTLELWTSISASGLAVGDTIKAIARCDRTSTDCKKFQGHLLNFGGYENIPAESSLTRTRTDD
ncbi:MAG: DUF2163 domain-containing protein [Waterburya sp.]